MYTVYALKSKKDGRIYVGFTSNLTKRLKEHNEGQSKSTKGYRPWILHHAQNVRDRIEARHLEKKWKAGSGKEYLKNIKNCAHSSAG